MLFLNMIMIIRYIFIFCLRNPAGFRDDYWSVFLKLWVMLFSWISVITAEVSIQGDSYHVQICSGFVANHLKSQRTTLNVIVGVCTLLIHVVISVKIHLYKRKRDRREQPHSKNAWLKILEERSLSDLTTNLIVAIGIGQAAFSPIIVANIEDVTYFNVYPFYLLEYYYRMIRPPLTFTLMIVIYYIRHKSFRESVYRQFQKIISEFNL